MLLFGKYFIFVSDFLFFMLITTTGYNWDEEPLVLSWARGSFRISKTFCRLILEARREVDSFLSAAVIEYVEMRLHEVNLL